MKIAPILTSCLLTAALGGLSAYASEPVTLSFERTGTDAESITVNVAGVEGATATVTTLSHSVKNLSNASIVCPDVNGNTSPEILLGITLTGLPSDFSFNTTGLHIHALNASGGYQQNNDNKSRRFNVAVGVNDNEFTYYDNIDIAAGVPDSHKVWEETAESAVTATSPLELTIAVTAGSANVGCFFGLESITLSSTEASVTPEPDPDPVVPPVDPTGSKFYTIKWKNNTSSYMTELADGGIAIGEYATSNKVFWEFIPTDNENCFYIRNTASGNYIGSCNMTPSSASKVTTSKTPVEYYVHLSAATSGDNFGCYWLSSTDCANYNSETSSARCLNKDGASANVITWTAAVANVGSYWTLTETENLYEIKPFVASPEIGQAATYYNIINPDGLAYTHEGNWESLDPTANGQKWYFVGTSNSAGGYQIVAYGSNSAINDGASYKVTGTDGVAPYHFIDANNEMLKLADVSDFTFVTARSSFALDNQIYKMPCGSTGTVYIRKVTIGSDYHYPMGSKSGSKITYSSASLPSNKYVMLTRDAATVSIGSEAELNVNLNRLPGDYKVYAYFDWNRDGYFETTQEITSDSKELQAKIEVPADAALGKTRLRIRVTDNGLAGCDDDTHGEVLDLMLNVINEGADLIDPVVKVNDANRGTATWAEGTASATPKGNSTFLYWTEGYRMLSLDSDFAASAATYPRTLTAFFAPNTQEMDGIDEITLSSVDKSAEIVYDGSVISVKTSAEVKAIVVYAINGAKAAGTTASSLSVSNLVPGVYIVKAVTTNGVASLKIKI